jgi:hypothetical protein
MKKLIFFIATFLLILSVDSIGQKLTSSHGNNCIIRLYENNAAILCSGGRYTFTARAFKTDWFETEFTNCASKWEWYLINSQFNSSALPTGWENQATLLGLTGNSITTILPTGPATIVAKLVGYENDWCDAQHSDAHLNSYGKIGADDNYIPDFTIAGNTAVACGSPTTLSASADYPLSYTWSYNNTTNPSVTVSPVKNTTYYVTGRDCNRNFKTRSVTVTVAPFPVTVTTGAEQCPGGTFTLSASGAQSYTWTGPGLNSTSGSTVTGSVVNNGPGYTTSSYQVTGNIPGCAPVTASTNVIVYSSRLATPIIPASDQACVNSGQRTYGFIGTDNNNATYQWSLGWGANTVATFVSGTTGPTATVAINPNAGNSSFNIGVQVSNKCGVKSPVGSLTVNVSQSAPATPSGITGPLTVCNSGSVSAYSLGQMTAGVVYEVTPAAAIASSTTNQYGQLSVDWNNSFTGTAYIRAYVRNGCGSSGWSPVKTVNVINGTCREGISAENGAAESEETISSVYPNPSIEGTLLSIRNAESEISGIEIYDAEGNLISSEEGIESGTQMMIGEDFRPGLYLINVRSEHSSQILKFIRE